MDLGKRVQTINAGNWDFWLKLAKQTPHCSPDSMKLIQFLLMMNCTYFLKAALLRKQWSECDWDKSFQSWRIMLSDCFFGRSEQWHVFCLIHTEIVADLRIYQPGQCFQIYSVTLLQTETVRRQHYVMSKGINHSLTDPVWTGEFPSMHFDQR